MPFGSPRNNAWFMVAVVGVSLSCVSAVIGQVLWNTKNLKVAIVQQEELILEHREMLGILRHLERRYLDGAPK